MAEEGADPVNAEEVAPKGARVVVVAAPKRGSQSATVNQRERAAVVVVEHGDVDSFTILIGSREFHLPARVHNEYTPYSRSLPIPPPLYKSLV